jgi:hypothetical protein
LVWDLLVTCILGIIVLSSDYRYKFRLYVPIDALYAKDMIDAWKHALQCFRHMFITVSDEGLRVNQIVYIVNLLDRVE